MRNLNLILCCIALLAVGALAQSLPTATLTASSAFSGTALGASVAISGSTVAATGGVVVNGRTQGVIYVFTKPAAAPWTDMTESAQLVSPDGGLGNVAINGDGSLIVSIGSAEVCVFARPLGGWKGTIAPVATLLQSLPLKPWVIQGDLGSIAVNSKGDTIVAGAYNAGTQGHLSEGKQITGVREQGAAYVWVEPIGGWAKADRASETAKLTAFDGADFDHFGYSVGISTNTIVAGAPSTANGSARSQGAAYLFTRPAKGVWLNTSKFRTRLTASDAKVNDSFGVSVAVGNSGALAAVSSGRGCGNFTGTSYVFVRPVTWWPSEMTQTAELTSSDNLGSCFGFGIAADSQLVVVGAPSALNGAGAGYTFAKPVNGWIDMSAPASIVGGTGSAGFGFSSAINGRTTAVGAPYSTVNEISSAGAVYLFSN